MSGRCKSCNKVLSYDELTRKDHNGQYMDMCRHCWKTEDDIFSDQLDLFETEYLDEENEDHGTFVYTDEELGYDDD